MKIGKTAQVIGFPLLYPQPLWTSSFDRSNRHSLVLLFLKVVGIARNNIISSNMGENLTSLDPSTLSNIPLLSPPAGVTPNFANPASNIQPFLIVTSVSLGIMLMFVVNRTYVKTFLIRKYSWDDCECSTHCANCKPD